MRTNSLPYLLLLLLFTPTISAAAPTPVNVGVILDLDTPVGRMSNVSMAMAVADFYASHPNSTTRLRLHVRNSHRDIVDAASAAVDLISTAGAAAILGPQTSLEASFVADLGGRAHVPVVAFSATSPSLSPSLSPFFVRAAPSDAASAAAVAALVSSFGWRRAVPIYENSDYGVGFVPYLVDALDAAGSSVPYRSSVSPSASDDWISAELYRLETLQTRVFIVHATSALSLRIFTAANSAGMISAGFAWIATDALTSLLGTIEPSVILDSMQGVLGVKPYVHESGELRNFRSKWRREFIHQYPTVESPTPPELPNFGIWAYDAVQAVASAAESVGPAISGASKSTGLSNLGTSRTGRNLLEAIRKTELDGLGGRFRLVEGELNVSAFQIVNVVGEKGNSIGFWTSRFGLKRRLGQTAARDGVGPVIWPGEVTAVPRGWEEPTAGKKLRIAVPGPEEVGFRAFLDVERDPATNETVARGFVVEVFEAAVKKLPYALPFEYVAYETADGKKSLGDYNTLVRQVPETYDAVVGDVTITANRSQYVDFTLPYTVSGVAMVVPVRDERSNNMWIFLRPLTMDLWLVSGAFFVFTGLVVWVLEHRINPEFRGPPDQQLGTVFYFSFSTLVFAHKEIVVSNLSRFAVTIWVFVVLILQSSYTASLTSMLTVRELKPTITDMRELIRSNEYVGHLKDSFVRGLLIKLGFDPSRLRPYQSPDQYEEALSKGSKNGGVAAIIDEVPYLKVFLRDRCQNYTMAGQTYKTGGFGFVFPKGSPIVSDLSKAILNLTEGDEMAEIETRWFGDQPTCPSQDNPVSSNRLDFKSFSGLFIITGTASTTCFFIYLFSFLYKNWGFLDEDALDNSVRWRLRSIAKLYDQKDESSHAFKRSELKDGSVAGASTIRDPTASPYNPSESPISTSHYTYGDGLQTPASVEFMMSPRSETPPLHVEIEDASR